MGEKEVKYGKEFGGRRRVGRISGRVVEKRKWGMIIRM